MAKKARYIIFSKQYPVNVYETTVLVYFVTPTPCSYHNNDNINQRSRPNHFLKLVGIVKKSYVPCTPGKLLQG